MLLGIPSEIKTGERRVALAPSNVRSLADKGVEILFQSGAGVSAGYPDTDYADAGATLVDARERIFAEADIILQVQSFGANNENSDSDLKLLRHGQLVIGMMDPLASPQAAQSVAATGASAIALELVPRISRAQSMDVLSSMATLSGYKSVLMGASASPRIFPMLMTAAGTLQPARVLIMGVGVAGLQAIATAKRLGAVVSATDVRSAAAEQVESLGGKFIMVDTDEDGETAAGYAKEMSEDYKLRQAALISETLKKQDIAITTALIPGRPAPVLITDDMVLSMKSGSVIVDLAVEAGGNCSLSKPGETIVSDNGVIIIGNLNMPSRLAADASALYAKNLLNFIMPHVSKKGAELSIDWEDEIIIGTLLTKGGAIVNDRLKGKS